MALALQDKWIWDFWLARDGKDWHIYFLQADKSLKDPELRHRHVSIGHARSTDLCNWEQLGTCFEPAPEPAWDDWTTWTGSVIRDPKGLWHLFYTGTRRGPEMGLKQRIGHAISSDLHNWVRVGDGLALDLDPSRPDYEEFTPGVWHDRAMRDPHVIENPDGPGWLMFFTARQPGLDEPNAGGTIGQAWSPDLYRWELRAPAFAGKAFGQMEVPQVFKLDEHWYLLFCTDARHWSAQYRSGSQQTPVTGTHYLLAPSVSGPWSLAPGHFLDGAESCERYSGKIVLTDQGPVFLGFLAQGPDGFIGVVSDPIPVEVGDNALLSLAFDNELGATVPTSRGPLMDQDEKEGEIGRS